MREHSDMNERDIKMLLHLVYYISKVNKIEVKKIHPIAPPVDFLEMSSSFLAADACLESRFPYLI